MKKMTLWMLVCAVVLTVQTNSYAKDKETTISVYAAASLRNVMNEVASKFEQEQKLRHMVEFNYAGSNDLAHQIVATPGADIYISANEEWMDHIEKNGRMLEGTRKDLVGNRLVVIANQSSTWKMAKPEDITQIPFRFLSIANPEAVPAGRYAKAYFTKQQFKGKTLWDEVSARLAPALDVRAALAVVETDASVLGIVYRTDVEGSTKVKVLYEIPEGDVPPIHYAAARVKHKGADPMAEKLFTFLFSKTAQDVFVKHGFVPVVAAKSSGKK